MARRSAGVVTAVAVMLLAAQLMMAAPAAADGDLSVSPRIGPPGTTILISGSDFDGGTVALCWDGRGCSNLGKTSTDGDGDFSIQVSVKPNAKPGPHLVTACVQDDECGQALFFVTRGSPPTTEATTTTTTTTTIPSTTTTRPSPPSTVADPTPAAVSGPVAPDSPSTDQSADPDPTTTTTLAPSTTYRLEAQTADPQPVTTTEATESAISSPADRYVPPQTTETSEVLDQSVPPDQGTVGQATSLLGDMEPAEAAPVESPAAQGALPWVLLSAGTAVIAAAFAMIVHYVRRPQ